MNVRGLIDEQRRRLKANLVRPRDGLDALLKRMQSIGWFADDVMFQTILAARQLRRGGECKSSSPHIPIDEIDMGIALLVQRERVPEVTL